MMAATMNVNQLATHRGATKVESLSIAELNDFVITAPSQACQPELECFYGKHLLIV